MKKFYHLSGKRKIRVREIENEEKFTHELLDEWKPGLYVEIEDDEATFVTVLEDYLGGLTVLWQVTLTPQILRKLLKLIEQEK